MKLSVAQVAEKLHCSQGAVRKFRDAGKLTDLRARKEGASKHYSYFDSKEVNEFAKTYSNRKASGKVNGLPGPITEVLRETVTTNSPTGIFSTLTRIEEKIDKLLTVWS